METSFPYSVIKKSFQNINWTVSVVLPDQTKYVLVENSKYNIINIFPCNYSTMNDYQENQYTDTYYYKTMDQLIEMLTFMSNNPEIYTNYDNDSEDALFHTIY